METLTKGELTIILNDHQKWLVGTGGKRANLSNADLRGTNLSNINLSRANLFGANLFGADLSNANLSNANLSNANLSNVDLSNANLSNANLSNANLNNADLSGAKGLLDPIKYIEENFEKTEDGIIVYKSFGEHYMPNPNWEIAEGSIIKEMVNPLPTVKYGSGINVATKEWAERERECDNPVWECLIRWEWLVGVVVPYQTEGQIRASKIQLIKPIWTIYRFAGSRNPGPATIWPTGRYEFSKGVKEFK